MHFQFVENIKQKVGDYVFKRDLKHNERKREVHNLHTAKSIGILYDATDLNDMMLVSEFANDLFKSKKDVKALGFVNRNELTHHHMPMLQFDFFFLKDLNWYYKPQNYIIKNFLEKEYESHREQLLIQSEYQHLYSCPVQLAHNEMWTRL